MMRSAPQAGTTPELELAAETFAPACMARAKLEEGVTGGRFQAL
jgi:hypothetical protein